MSVCPVTVPRLCLCVQVLSFVESLASGAVHLGVPWHEALQMAAKTVSRLHTVATGAGRSPNGGGGLREWRNAE